MIDTLAMIVPCHPYADVLKVLRDTAGEEEVASGITSRGEAFKLFLNTRTQSFTVIIRGPKDATCVLSAGTDFEIKPMGQGL